MTNFILQKLSLNEKETILSLLQRKEYLKGEILIKEGAHADKVFIIISGACRSYFIKNGEDITDFFFLENSFATDFASFCSHIPTTLILECIEDCVVDIICRKDLELLYQQSHTFSEMGRLMAEYSYLQIEERMRLLHTESLEIKYNWMLKNFPHIFQRVPQHYIATYLGVKPQSLSRIRAKISGKTY